MRRYTTNTIVLANEQDAESIVSIIGVYGVTRPTVDGTTVTIGPDALDILRELPEDHDGHYDGTSVWVGGAPYHVRCGTGRPKSDRPVRISASLSEGMADALDTMAADTGRSRSSLITEALGTLLCVAE